MNAEAQSPSARGRTSARTKRGAAPKAVLGPGDWINAALTVLATETIDAVRVDVLAKRMNVTRGSFYWHFEDRDDLLGRLLEHWRKTTTERVIERFTLGSNSPGEMLKGLLALPYHGRTAAHASSVEMAIREWARRHEAARLVVAEVDNQRLGYIAQCFTALGCSLSEARHRADIFYATLIGQSILGTQILESQIEERLRMLGQLFVDSATGPKHPA